MNPKVTYIEMMNIEIYVEVTNESLLLSGLLQFQSVAFNCVYTVRCEQTSYNDLLSSIEFVF